MAADRRSARLEPASSRGIAEPAPPTTGPAPTSNPRKSSSTTRSTTSSSGTSSELAVQAYAPSAKNKNAPVMSRGVFLAVMLVRFLLLPVHRIATLHSDPNLPAQGSEIIRRNRIESRNSAEACSALAEAFDRSGCRGVAEGYGSTRKLSAFSGRRPGRPLVGSR